MSKLARLEDVQISPDLSRIPYGLRFERMIWALMGFVLLIGIMGPFLSQPISKVHASTADGALQVTYDRFSHVSGSTEMRIRLPGLASVEGHAVLWVDHDYLDRYQIEEIFPHPQEIQEAGDRTIYYFSASQPGQPFEVTLKLASQESGLLQGRIGWGQDPGLQISQWVLP